ncbi:MULTISPECIES: hypothetical protein [Pseudoalteromonas]|uniref:Avidin family n=1 Tax=Pseudoalteromonas luteoviolacea (strain 2ta16) TaxID=1353533 RepID=V4HDJ5_PSEL2|nr:MULTISPECIES: hypothetical protein [Pseudoalteromonas]ESP95526.1 hypothetical protein PL2TA16_02270 [Pseudoalteromonas luteoviolacea 2ta16]KZN31083.1 hypothetical protein N483_04480 [Pseudoalteromonas luteoviolacea NCIMB 1944]MCG7548501.1 hypothetical protein [Pseudoalteromonas sp. Of7M-16]
MIHKVSTLAALFLGATLSFNAAATKTHYCFGKVSNVHLTKNGSVSASFSGIGSTPLSVTNSVVCSLQGGSDGHTSEYCHAMYSALLLGLSTQNTVTMWFKNNESSCPTGDWTSLVSKGLYHFRIVKA